MPTVKTGYWIREEDGVVKDVWDYDPSDSPKGSLLGWREAVEVFPDLVEGREIHEGHTIDLSKTPAEIVWNKYELSVDDRKGALKNIAKGDFQEVVQQEMRKELDNFPETQYDAQVVEAAKTVYENAMNAINALTTHEEIDAYIS